MATLKEIFSIDTEIEADQNSWSSVPAGFFLLIARLNTSTTSNTVGTGAKTFTLSSTTNQEWAASGSVTVISTADPANSMTGTVTSYNSGTQVLVINVTSTTGSGTAASWALEDLTSPFVLLIEDDGDKLLIE